MQSYPKNYLSWTISLVFFVVNFLCLDQFIFLLLRILSLSQKRQMKIFHEKLCACILFINFIHHSRSNVLHAATIHMSIYIATLKIIILSTCYQCTHKSVIIGEGNGLGDVLACPLIYNLVAKAALVGN